MKIALNSSALFCGAAAMLCLLSVVRSSHAADAESAAGFTFHDDSAAGQLDVLLDGKIVARYMYAHDVSTPARRLETYKPYLHVFNADGTEPITKGPGGLFPHHRGIFIGWNIIDFDGKKYDRWHMKGGDIVHTKFENQSADANHATFTSDTGWLDENNQPFIDEARTITISRAPRPGRIVIDFTSKITAPRGDVKLGGDPEHAGVHYRPADDLDKSKTIYVFPMKDPKPHKDVDYPWVGETYTLKGNQYSIVEMSSPENPKKTHWSAYRDYGRLGAFPVAEVKQGESRTFKYRFMITDGQMPPADVIEANYDQFIGAPTPSAVPEITVMPAEKAASPTTKPAKKQ